MPDTIEGLAVGLAFLIPGVAYELGIERLVGYWRTSLADRVLRFFLVSSVLQATFAPATFLFWRERLNVPLAKHETYAHAISTRYVHLPYAVWVALLAYVTVPFALGLLTGRLARQEPAGLPARFLVGRDPAPRSWDYLFGRPGVTGVVRARLKGGGWVAGLYTKADSGNRRGYASSFPITEDVYLPVRVKIDSATGELETHDDKPIQLAWSMLLCREDIDVLEFLEISA